MALYEYQCRECGLVSEDSSPEAELIHCLKKMRRLFSIAGVMFKGPGFYHNDKKTPGNPYGS